VDGKIVGSGTYEEPSWIFEEGKYFLRVAVHPDYQRQGIGTAIYDTMMAAFKNRQPKLLVASTRQNQPEAVRFLEKRDFQLVQREPMSRLDIEQFDVSRFQTAINRSGEAGVQIMSGKMLIEHDADFWRKLYDFDAVATQDLPLPSPYTMPEFEVFVNEMSDARRGFVADYWMIAVAPPENGMGYGKYVGRSTLWQDVANPQKVHTGLTAVLQDYRRQGLATALKARVIESSRQRGVTVVETQNEENNAMLQLNLALGFEIFNAYLGYEKRLE
jgi:GNAT superfamily N-acetyltransferase